MDAARRAAACLVVGVVLTLLLAFAERTDAGRERDLLFEGAVERLQASLQEELEDELVDFRSTIRFIEATHPGPIDEYQAFVDADSEPETGGEAGALLLERVPRQETQALEARERAMGNEDFTVVLIPVTGSHRLVVTRAGSSQRLLGLPSMGLDLTESISGLLQNDLGRRDLESYLVPSNRLVNMMRFVVEEQADDFTLILLAPVDGDDEELIGYSLVFRSMELLLDRVEPELSPGLGIQLTSEGEVVGGRGPVEPLAANIESTDQIAIAGTVLELRVFADDRFGPSTDLKGQWRILAAGLMLTVLATAFDQGRIRSRRRLVETRLELARAQTIASLDPLTGLLNRAGFLDAARGIDDKAPASVLFVDLDGFKRVNDSFGHEEGDDLLRRVGNSLLEAVRAEELLSRHGGDEFVAYLPTADHDAVGAIAERMIEAVEATDAGISCSIGIAVRSPGRPVDVKEMLRAADAAMYAAKVAGGGRYVITDAGLAPTGGPGSYASATPGRSSTGNDR